MADIGPRNTLSEEMRPPGKPARAFSFDGSGNLRQYLAAIRAGHSIRSIERGEAALVASGKIRRWRNKDLVFAAAFIQAEKGSGAKFVPGVTGAP
jgi:hypothetical protein